MTHQVTQLDHLGVGRHNPPAGQQGSMHPGLTFGYVMTLAALYETVRHSQEEEGSLDSTVDMQIVLKCEDVNALCHSACCSQALPKAGWTSTTNHLFSYPFGVDWNL